MRDDFKKVVAERSRRNGYSYHDFRRAERAGDPDLLPTHQGMRRPYLWGYDEYTKPLRPLYGPVRRYLHAQVGRPWNAVWSEVCAVSRGSSGPGLSPRDLVRYEVCDRVIDRDGQPYRMRYGMAYPITDGFYVEPGTGILRDAGRHRSSRDGYRKRVQLDGVWHTQVGDLLVVDGTGIPRKIMRHGADEAVCIDGIWYWVVFAEVPPPTTTRVIATDGREVLIPVHRPRYDFVTGKWMDEGRCRTDKRQMNRRDLDRHGLVNTRSPK